MIDIPSSCESCNTWNVPTNLLAHLSTVFEVALTHLVQRPLLYLFPLALLSFRREQP